MNLKNLIFSLLLIFLPSQLGLHFWPEWAFINGVRIDYFSPTLYLTDILVLILLFLEIFNLKFAIFNKFPIKKFSIVCLFVLLNTYFSLSPFVSFNKWLKVAELAFLVWWVARHKPSLKWLVIPIIYSCLLAIWQYFNHGSVGGLWYLLGERAFTNDTPGIAPGRPYATFPHPNVLMGFLVVASLLVMKKLTHFSRKITALILGVVILVLFLLPSRGDLLKGWRLRQQLNNIAIEQWTKSPVFGTGLGTSPLYPRNISNYALLHQPIHNIYLLVLAETGLGGLVIWGILGIWGYRRIRRRPKNFFLLASLFFILFSGLVDHYWLTLQQTQLLFVLILGIM